MLVLASIAARTRRKFFEYLKTSLRLDFVRPYHEEDMLLSKESAEPRMLKLRLDR